ncbi:uncharacterized protein PGTG_16625 [Puccinia graminis f. sp. tritici CRL 75-36-700-3]|uniref:Uncharacterized protein n=1 Tax=Puccinia graminis f. sp. tritici (strain CRL 75-36-700-3 / race SCCL) TaxID=418459 RepID=E3L224_PUCGT|nr:uncharacterized protein PGTG_16625 [Puccinia graminis f. sp. tritici CRL 75-36-700-3]EFP90599.1 hypothetical protein PGTG_16625 [Puccinia graminis f. sp. tritici CRL 75-36-700-3]
MTTGHFSLFDPKERHIASRRALLFTCTVQNMYEVVAAVLCLADYWMIRLILSAMRKLGKGPWKFIVGSAGLWQPVRRGWLVMVTSHLPLPAGCQASGWFGWT